MSAETCSRIGWLGVLLALLTPTAHAILAGGEFDVPADSPSNRLDPLGITSPFNFVGALSIFTGSQTYYGSAVALSPNWVLTAGHNVDFNDDGQVDDGLAVSLHLPGVSVQSPTSITMHPSFTGFGNPSIHHDLSLFYFEDPIHDDLFTPTLGLYMSRRRWPYSCLDWHCFQLRRSVGHGSLCRSKEAVIQDTLVVCTVSHRSVQ